MIKPLCSTLLLLIFAVTTSVAYGQGKEISKTYNWKYSVNDDAIVNFVNYDCDLVIHTWEKQEIEYRMLVNATMKSDEDAERLDEFIESLNFTESGDKVKFNNRFWDSRINIMGRKTIKLPGEGSLRYSEFKIAGELWIPESVSLEMVSKYSRIDLEKLGGGLKMNLYNDKVYGDICDSDVEIEAKYSTIELKEILALTATLYDCELYIGNTGNVTIESKYSKVFGGNTGNLDLNSYNDKFDFDTTADIKYIAKYSDIKADKAGKFDVNSYEGTAILDEVGDVEMVSKYTKYEFGSATNCVIKSSYSDRINSGIMESLAAIESKYGKYDIGELSKSVSVDVGYEDKIVILKTGDEFGGINVNGKYMDIEMGIPASLNFRLKADIKYPKLEMDEESLAIRIKILEGSQLKYDAVRGTEKEGMPVIALTGYEMSLKIVDL